MIQKIIVRINRFDIKENLAKDSFRYMLTFKINSSAHLAAYELCRSACKDAVEFETDSVR
ncbi:MAG: hypothetical protein ACI870_000393 [Crocinitomicaceae bacterium]|jgi:hypothetical protein